MTVTCPTCGHESADTEWCDDCGRPLTGGDPALPLHATGPILPAPRCPACGERRLGRFCQGCGYNFEDADDATPISGDTRLAPGPYPADPGPLPGPADPDRAPGVTGPGSAHLQAPSAVPGSADADPAHAQAPGPADRTADPDRAPAPAAPLRTQPTPLQDTGFEVHISADREFYDRLADDPDADTPVWPPYRPERVVALRGDTVRIGRRRSDGTGRPEIDLSEPPGDKAVSHLHAVLMREGDTWNIVDLDSANGTRLAGRRLEANVSVPVPEGAVIHLGAFTALRLRRSGTGGPR
ncbi:FHA domain-containing protein [Glycomyces terrestris]|uniref:FHA domain-containing protein n=1 Tax=Glycomyces terrestris TaxID=2493553 RepID=A0A426UT43_9ACTN|nr:FHA domain-containing protein [Glycomyces terrestris]RRR96823.1 FHA domain-containing protein [Glycomyces terrestris]